MDTVSIASLKAKLSSYLRSVKAGRELWVTDRGRPIARLSPVNDLEASRQDLIEAGLVRPPLRKHSAALWKRLPRKELKGAGVLDALISERDESR